MATIKPFGEGIDERVLRKARDLREALLAYGVVLSRDQDLILDELPPARREKWLALAREYIRIFITERSST